MSAIRIRPARVSDLPVLFTMIREMAQFLNHDHVFIVTQQQLKKHLFDKPIIQCMIAELTESDAPVGYMAYYNTFSTFRGTPGIHLEDIFVRDGFREKKVGRSLIHAICQIAKKQGCSRIQWEAPADNDRANRFYNSLDVPTVGGWIVYRITNALNDFADSRAIYEFEEPQTPASQKKK
ncbi:MAG: GNAT family N-acetyltransferase [Candidatus Andersenbacteria bacterium]|nr:GNAT family N-acetyltransferase [Candidatus Andersenbacteria bacterium]